VSAIAEHRRSSAALRRGASATLLTPFGRLTATPYRSVEERAEQVALVKGVVARRHDVLVGVESDRLAVASSLRAMARERCGVLLYRPGLPDVGTERMSVRILADLGVGSARPLNVDVVT
jgi:hypothetical protein